MAKGKPSRAFLEALKQDKKRHGNEKSGGGFKTPEWFFNNQSRVETAAPPPQVTPNTLQPATVAKKSTYQFKPMHAAAAAAVVLVLVSISYFAGRRQQTPQLGPTSEQVRESAPMTGVLEPMDRTVATTPPAPVPVPAANVGDIGQPAPAEPAGRVVGMNYVVIQSYKEEQLANEAAAALRAGGLGCTVEHGLPGYSATWYSVVGTQGFTKATTPDYQAYLRKVEVVSNKFAGNSKWKQFEPNPYKWR